ncbi:hypothetical protein GIB67_004030 [Kingdonia uniflora]|uniref:Major facilitator superfamily (MFS) profile domain-containing protein n=1 Tax=Kingdonia uniflora TaxID=39325 RepID=A0A7J7NRT8_9MAGN|nr:hypothetical protein GIB67_004030 [Kingdonia uniflora]
MAGGAMVLSVGPNKSYSGGMTFYVFWAILVASCGGLIFGYDIGISGGVTAMHPFLMKFFPSVYEKEIGIQNTNQYCTFNSETLTLFTSSLYLAALVASFVASTVTRKLGRKISMILGGILFLIGAGLNGIALNVAMLYIGRVFLGVGVGFASQSVPLYLSEMAPCMYRGRLNVLFQLMITIGILIANLVNYGSDKIKAGWGWRLSLALAAVPALIVVFGASFLPDTPNYLIDSNKHKEAKAVLKRIRGTDDIDEEYNDISLASQASKSVNDPWKKILERKYRPHIIMAALLPGLQQLTGINVVMFYAPVLFKTLGFGNEASLASAVITGGVNVAATGVAVVSQPYAIGVVFCICCFVAGFAWSWGPLAWLVPSEICPLEIRSAAQSITVAVNMLFTFIIAQIFPWLLCNAKFGLFYVFAFFTLVMASFVWYYLPETRGVPIEEMWSVWKEHKVWGKYIPDDVMKTEKTGKPSEEV